MGGGAKVDSHIVVKIEAICRGSLYSSTIVTKRSKKRFLILIGPNNKEKQEEANQVYFLPICS